MHKNNIARQTATACRNTLHNLPFCVFVVIQAHATTRSCGQINTKSVLWWLDRMMLRLSSVKFPLQIMGGKLGQIKAQMSWAATGSKLQ